MGRLTDVKDGLQVPSNDLIFGIGRYDTLRYKNGGKFKK